MSKFIDSDVHLFPFKRKTCDHNRMLIPEPVDTK